MKLTEKSIPSKSRSPDPPPDRVATNITTSLSSEHVKTGQTPKQEKIIVPVTSSSSTHLSQSTFT